MSEELLPKHGGYRKLKGFQVGQLVYDLTVRFCDRYIDKRSRTHDQMVQAARSGVQNIAEGSKISATSKKMEIKLTNVARASLEELRLDYQDFLRHRGLPEWDRNDPRRQELIDRRPKTVAAVARWAQEVHGRGGEGGQSGQSGRSGQPPTGQSASSTVSTGSTGPTYPEIAANGALALTDVAIALLGRQVEAQAAAFERDGGFTERLYRSRIRQRGNTASTQPPAKPV